MDKSIQNNAESHGIEIDDKTNLVFRAIVELGSGETVSTCEAIQYKVAADVENMDIISYLNFGAEARGMNGSEFEFLGIRHREILDKLEEISWLAPNNTHYHHHDLLK